ncbi:MAG TPA: leucyl aminopeptidase [Chthoniobacteraceae bacterium]|nr:leucyl aminopeptidase [Chthoniobacteraceae bacterium]
MKLTIDSNPVPAKGEIKVVFLPPSGRAALPDRVTEAEFSGKPNSTLFLHAQGLLAVGIGTEATAQTFRSAAGTAVKLLKKTGRTSAVMDAAKHAEHTQAIAEGAVLADYRFEQFKTTRTEGFQSLRVAAAKTDVLQAKRNGARGKTVADAVNYARQIGNQPGNFIYPAALADEARKLARAKGLRVTVFDEKALRAGKFGGILAVGQGSARPPRMIVLEHRGGKAGEAPVALVGKAITFDTGGISIKPAANMEEMIFDKSGGMAVLGAMAAIADLKLQRNVVGIIASAENMPGSNAYRPGDIVTAFDGKHIEILNTDAEGRVVLADAIGYARKVKKAAAIIDLATLTGAIGIALGDAAAGLWSTSTSLKEQVLAASEKTGERLWPMPLYPEYDDLIKSEVALVKNTGGRLAGSSTAAAFLKTFAGETPWAHLDIAYTASIEKERADLARGATGFGIRTLVELVDAWQSKKGK